MRYLAICQYNQRPQLRGFISMGGKPEPLAKSCHVFTATGDVEVIGYEPKEFLVKLIAGEVMEHENLHGPASLRDKTLIYPCEMFRCRIGCPCKMCRHKLTKCDDFKDHEAFHKANHTMCQFCADLERVIPHFHYKIIFETVYRSGIVPQFEDIWYVKLGSAALFLHHTWTQNPLKIDSQYHCDKCEKTFKKLCHLKRHEISVHFLKKENCPHCGLQCSRRDNLKAHIQLVHGNDDSEFPFQCDDCQETFDRKSSFERHSRNLKTNCSICAEFFCTLKQLQQHRMKSHPKYECSKCEKTFQDQAHLNRHLKVSRSNLICEVCNQEFCTTVDFRKHMKSHEQEKFECSFCQKRFSTNSIVKTHMANRIDHKCEQCDLMFCNKRNFDLHYHEVHGVKTCETCCKTYDLKNFKYHMYSEHQQLV